jgi:hypothetical protein
MAVHTDSAAARAPSDHRAAGAGGRLERSGGISTTVPSGSCIQLMFDCRTYLSPWQEGVARASPASACRMGLDDWHDRVDQVL